MSAQIYKDMWQSGAYCDTDSMQGEVDPRRLYFDNDRGRQERVEEELNKVESGELLIQKAFDYPIHRIPSYRLLDHFWAGR